MTRRFLLIYGSICCLFLVGVLIYNRYLYWTILNAPVGEGETTESIVSPQISLYNFQDEKIANFTVELAQTEAERDQGLMNRDFLPEKQGMLFIYPQEQPLAFWMKNTLIPLDMIFIASDKQIINIVHQAQPCQTDPCPLYRSSEPGQYVLEINGGSAQELGIEEGMRVEFNRP